MQTIKFLFAAGPSLNVRILTAVLLSIMLITAQQRERNTNKLRSALSVVVFPLQYLVNLPSDISYWASNNLYTYNALLQENKDFKHKQLILKNRLLKFEALEKENIRLRALLENSFKLGEQVLVAELLSVNLVPYEHLVLVNKGSRFGVSPRQPVIDADGIVGQIIRSNPLSSEIMLITDPSHAIPVQINRNGLRTIAIGSGQLDRLNLPFLPNNADIVPGDLLISSGLGGVFPQGYPVAVVDKITPQPDKPFANIHATPKAQFDRSREFLIVWSQSEPIPLTPLPETESEPESEKAQEQEEPQNGSE